MPESDILSVQLWWGAAAIAFLAIAISAAGWNHKYFVWAMFLLAGMLAVAAVFWRQIRLTLPDGANDLMAMLAADRRVWFAVFCFGVTAILAITKMQVSGSKGAIPRPISTSLRLQFHPDSINPTCLYIENIWVWYALCTMFTMIEGPSEQHQHGRQHVIKQWTLFLVFDRPTTVKQILVDGSGVKLPLVEVKDRGPRHAIITINGDLGGAVVDVKVMV